MTEEPSAALPAETAPKGLAGVAAAIGAPEDPAGARPPPPVHLWNPPSCGEIDIRIARDGTWLHEGSPIGRPALVRLFSSVLRLDPDGYHLVTPVEKLRIRVDDAPFLAVRVDRVGEAIRFLTNVGDAVEVGPEHGLVVEAEDSDGAPAPYVDVRRGLRARLTRPVFYELVETAEARDGELGVWSRGVWFPLGPAPADVGA
jgi:uncharacterized protein